MADEETGKRRRGRRRGRTPSQGPEIPPSQQQPDISATSGATEPGSQPSTGPGTTGSQQPGKSGQERHSTGGSAQPDVNPMDFWRSGRARSQRDRPVAAGGKGPGGLVHRVRHLYFPPWVPVVAIIAVVFGILGLLFVTRSATGAPHIGNDHWHATYTFTVCGEKQPNAPTWESGVHTHGDGVLHIHPFSRSEEGSGARLVKWFDYGGGKLSNSEVRLPGLSDTWKNGDVCPDGKPDAGQEGEVQVFVNSQKLDGWERYIPKDGDRIRIVFGPAEELVQLDDRTVLPEDQATRTVEIGVSGNEDTSAFDPPSISVDAGETVKIVLTNTAEVSHGMRIAGGDNEYDTADDFVVVPEGSDPELAEQGDIIEPGKNGFTVIRLDEAGTVDFKDPTANKPVDEGEDPEPYATGTIIVGEVASPTPTGPAEELVDQETNVSMQDGVFSPAEVTLAAGKKFRIKLKNDGQLTQNMRIAGPDGEFDTDDDILSDDVATGAEANLIGKIDEPGTYAFRNDFNPTRMTGTLTIQ